MTFKINFEKFSSSFSHLSDSGVESDSADADVLEASGTEDKSKLDQEILEAAKVTKQKCFTKCYIKWRVRPAGCLKNIFMKYSQWRNSHSRKKYFIPQ